jgi:hypothetical protein
MNGITKRNIVHIPEEGQLKYKRKQLERTIHPLPYSFNYFMKALWARKNHN